LDEIPEFWAHGYETGVVLFSLSTSFLAAYFFYVLDIFYPQKLKKSELVTRLELPLNRVLRFMAQNISCISNLTNLKYSELTTENIKQNINENWHIELKEAPMVTDNLKNVSYLFYFDHNIWDVENYIKRINSLPELDFELLMVLDKVLYSKLHEDIRYINQLKKTYPGITFVNDYILNNIEEYVKILLDIQDYMNKNKIPIDEIIREEINK